NSAVRNRSEPCLATISRSRSWRNRAACSRSMLLVRPIAAPPAEAAGACGFSMVDIGVPWRGVPAGSAGEVFLHGRRGTRFGHRDHVAPDQVRQALVERLHAERAAGL